ncbi:hypothetical protein A9G11_09740 [Gilliamella sp. wkB108]|uniref:hypothetical protein n=1 Tax=Gilliamella sp. wkB108 TaxID=3120256 RepID=UPI00080E6FC0|nr:hypothetical protein [Gilliamella apicola]OCG20165.1 hypothetical protein A9G11_09740 [Gilliamella apicola]
MAINLSSLPEPIILKKGLSRLFWKIALIVFIVIGLLLIYIIQFNSNITIEHIIIAVSFSMMSWFILLSIWLFFRGCKEVYVESWNQLREERKQQLIEYGQKPLYVIFNQLSSEFGQGNHAQAFVNELMTFDARPVTSSNVDQDPIIYSRFQFDNLKPHDFHLKIDKLFNELQNVLSILNNKLFNKFQKHIRLFVDVPISTEDVKKIWEDKLGDTTLFDSWQMIEANQSTVFLDSWLDDSTNDDYLLCCISLYLFDFPTSFSAEAMTSMLFLGKNLINNTNIIQYIEENNSCIVALHRTEEGEQLEYVLKHAELWGELELEKNNKAHFDAIWLTNLSPEANVSVLTRYTDKLCSIKNIYNICSTFGISGECDYWVALAFAIEHALEIDNKQMVIGQKRASFNATILEKIQINANEEI